MYHLRGPKYYIFKRCKMRDTCGRLNDLLSSSVYSRVFVSTIIFETHAINNRSSLTSFTNRVPLRFVDGAACLNLMNKDKIGALLRRIFVQFRGIKRVSMYYSLDVYDCIYMTSLSLAMYIQR